MDGIGFAVGADEVAERNESGNYRNCGKEHQGNGHGKGRLVRRVLMAVAFIACRLLPRLRAAPENAVIQSEHIECGHGGNHRHNPTHDGAEPEAGRQYLVLGEESGERGNAGNGKAGYQEGDVRNRHVFAQAAHGGHLVAVHRMDDASCTEEQQRLEHGVRKQVEHACHITQSAFVRVCGCTYAERYHHKAYLRDGGEGEYTLDVTLHTSHAGGIECGECAYIGHEVQHVGRIVDEQREHACHQVYACHHHRSGMNQCAHRSRTFHGIGQPDVQREHGALAGSADEHQSQRQRNHGSAAFQQCHFIGLEGVGSGIVTVNQDTDKEAQVGKAGHDKRFLAGGDCCGFRVVEAYQQVGRHTHQLPEQIHLEDIGCHHQSEHGHRKQREESVVALEAAFAFHIAERVEVHHERYGTYDNQHHHRYGVEQDAQVNAECRRERQPCTVVRHQCGKCAVCQPRGGEIVYCGEVGEYRHCTQHSRADESGSAVRHPFAAQSQHQEREQRKEKD